MKKHFNIVLLAASLTALSTISTYAMNACISNMDSHVLYHSPSKIHPGYYSLEMSNCKLLDRDIPQVVSFVNNHSEIIALNFRDNKLTGKTGNILANVINGKYLYIDNNLLGDEGAIGLADSKFFYITAPYNDIGNNGAIAFGKDTSLELLMVENNNIGDDGALGLAQTKNITYLRISDNQLSEKGKAALRKNHVIKNLDL